MMNSELAFEVNQLIQGWMYRDLGQWEKLRSLFHPDGTIEVTWFSGPSSEFVDASAAMGASDLRTKHVLGSPLIKAASNRAVAQTSAIIVAENRKIGVGSTTYARFHDWIERRNTGWKLLRRRAVYDLSSLYGPDLSIVDAAAVDLHPNEYGALAYVLESGGFPVNGRFATRGSTAEKALFDESARWLAATL